jgi:hypothetical protein
VHGVFTGFVNGVSLSLPSHVEVKKLRDPTQQVELLAINPCARTFRFGMHQIWRMVSSNDIDVSRIAEGQCRRKEVEMGPLTLLHNVARMPM